MVKETITKGRERGKKIVKGAEEKVANTFPWLKTSLGGLWTIIWFIIAVAVEAIVILVPILAIVAGIIFIIIAIASMGSGDVIDPWIIGSNNSKNDNKESSSNPTDYISQ